MANLTDSPVYEPGIYQLETDDPVQGGTPGFNDGVPVIGWSNAQAQQLANRTAYLKEKADQFEIDVVTVANDADRAENAADASLLSKGIWPTTAAGIGQGVAGTSAPVAGSGGTDDTFNLAFSGGTQVLAPRGRFVVSGGAVTQVIIDYPGYYSAGTPTISFAASAGLTGASVAAVMGPNTPVGGYFSIQSGEDAEYNIQYRVAAGPEAVDPKRYPAASRVSLIDTSVGLPYKINSITPSAGDSTVGSTNFVVNSTPVKADGNLDAVKLWAQVDGTAAVTLYRPPAGVTPVTGVTVTKQLTITFPVVAGLNIITTATLGAIPVKAGDIIGVNGNGILRFDSTRTGSGNRYYSISVGTTSPTLGSLISDVEWEFGFDLSVSQYDETSALGVAVKTNSLRELDIGPLVSFGAAVPAAGNTTSGSASFVLNSTPMARGGSINEAQLWAQADGSAFIGVYRPPAGVSPATGGALTRVSNTEIPVLAGLNTIDGEDLPPIQFQAGDLIGFAGNGILRYDTNKTGAGSRYWLVAGPSPTIGSLNSDVRWEIGHTVVYDYDETTSLGAAVKALQEAPNAGWQDTDSFIYVIGAPGQSNLASRSSDPSAFTIAAGRSYNYGGNTDTLVTLADPTGTDGPALSNNYSSMGPALAHSVLEKTGGRTGIIFLNAAIGATKTETWLEGGASWTAFVTKYNTTIAQINSLKLNVVGCVALGVIGESDAADLVTPTSHKGNMTSILDQLRTLTGIPNLKLILSQIGLDTTGSNASSYAAIRNAQAELTRENDGFVMAHSGAKYFNERGLMVDNLHYKIEAQDEIGGVVGAPVITYGMGLRPTGLTE